MAATLRASTALPSAATSPAATTPAIPSAVAASKIASAAAISATILCVFLRGIIVRRKILRRGSVRLRLALVARLAVRLANFVWLRVAVLFLGGRSVRLLRELQRSMVLRNFVRKNFIGAAIGNLVRGMGARQDVASQHFP